MEGLEREDGDGAVDDGRQVPAESAIVVDGGRTATLESRLMLGTARKIIRTTSDGVTGTTGTREHLDS